MQVMPDPCHNVCSMRMTWLCLGLVACGRIEFDPRSDAQVDAPGDAAAVECPADPRLIACYDFEGDAGDRSGHGNDATGIAVSYVAGRFGRAMRMDESSRADLDMPSLSTTQWTFDAWIRPDAAPAGLLELLFDHDSRWAIMFEETGGTLRFGCNSTVTQASVSTPLAAGTWYHVACTDDGTTLTGYVDGVGEVLGTGTGGGSTTTAAIGGNAPILDELSPYLGTIDRVRIWNVALTASELE